MSQHSAEWLRGAVEVLGRMMAECTIVFESDLPHITENTLEDYKSDYAMELSAAEAREAEDTYASAHDTRMKRLGAAEWLRENSNAEWLDVDQRERFRTEADRLMEGE